MQPEESRMCHCFFANSQSIPLGFIQVSFIPFENTGPIAQASGNPCIPDHPNRFSAPRLLPALPRVTNT